MCLDNIAKVDNIANAVIILYHFHQYKYLLIGFLSSTSQLMLMHYFKSFASRCIVVPSFTYHFQKQSWQIVSMSKIQYRTQNCRPHRAANVNKILDDFKIGFGVEQNLKTANEIFMLYSNLVGFLDI